MNTDRAAFEDYVRARTGLWPEEYDVVFDYVYPQGVRQIDIQSWTADRRDYQISTIYLPASQRDRFPPDLDIPYRSGERRGGGQGVLKRAMSEFSVLRKFAAQARRALRLDRIRPR